MGGADPLKSHQSLKETKRTVLCTNEEKIRFETFMLHENA